MVWLHCIVCGMTSLCRLWYGFIVPFVPLVVWLHCAACGMASLCRLWYGFILLLVVWLHCIVCVLLHCTAFGMASFFRLWYGFILPLVVWLHCTACGMVSLCRLWYGFIVPLVYCFIFPLVLLHAYSGSVCCCLAPAWPVIKANVCYAEYRCNLHTVRWEMSVNTLQ